MTDFKCRRLKVSDIPAVSALMATRGDSTIGLMSSRVSDTKLPALLDQPNTYRTDIVFGLFRDDRLRVVWLLRPTNQYCYYAIMLISEKTSEAKPLNARGYNKETESLMDYSVGMMEQMGFYVIFSAVPAILHERRGGNIYREAKNEYETSVIERVPAHRMPRSSIGIGLMTTEHEKEILILQRRRIDGRVK